MRILLFGSTGMLGSALENVFKNKKVDYVATKHEDVDITVQKEIKKTIKKYSPDIVINSAALVGNYQCMVQPEKTFQINSIAVYKLVQLCKKNNIILAQISSSSVFDGKKNYFYTENDIPNPISMYGASKYIAECFARNNMKKYYIFRLPLLFGNRRNIGGRFLDKAVNATKEGSTLKVSVDKIDSPTYTIDAANAIFDIINKISPFGVYHIANSGKVNLYDFMHKFKELSKSDVNLIRSREKDFKFADNIPLILPLKSIKIKPLRNWDEALNNYIKNDLQSY